MATGNFHPDSAYTPTMTSNVHNDVHLHPYLRKKQRLNPNPIEYHQQRIDNRIENFTMRHCSTHNYNQERPPIMQHQIRYRRQPIQSVEAVVSCNNRFRSEESNKIHIGMHNVLRSPLIPLSDRGYFYSLISQYHLTIFENIEIFSTIMSNVNNRNVQGKYIVMQGDYSKRAIGFRCRHCTPQSVRIAPSRSLDPSDLDCLSCFFPQSLDMVPRVISFLGDVHLQYCSETPQKSKINADLRYHRHLLDRNEKRDGFRWDGETTKYILSLLGFNLEEYRNIRPVYIPENRKAFTKKEVVAPTTIKLLIGSDSEVNTDEEIVTAVRKASEIITCSSSSELLIKNEHNIKKSLYIPKLFVGLPVILDTMADSSFVSMFSPFICWIAKNIELTLIVSSQQIISNKNSFSHDNVSKRYPDSVVLQCTHCKGNEQNHSHGKIILYSSSDMWKSINQLACHHFIKCKKTTPHNCAVSKALCPKKSTKKFDLYLTELKVFCQHVSQNVAFSKYLASKELSNRKDKEVDIESYDRLDVIAKSLTIGSRITELVTIGVGSRVYDEESLESTGIDGLRSLMTS